MSLYVTNNHVIASDVRNLISKRYHTITKAINRELWDIDSDKQHSFYVGSYGRGTAIDTSDLDVLVEVPERFNVISNTSYNPQSRLLQVVKNAILTSYPKSDVRGDGQVVVDFSDNMKFEVLPATKKTGLLGKESYTYPDTHMGGNWLSTNPKDEQNAMKAKNDKSGGLLFNACKHMRWVRDTYFKSYHLSGIVIDSFAYAAIGNWRYTRKGEKGATSGSFEKNLLDYYNQATLNGTFTIFELRAPGSGVKVNTEESCSCLGKVLNKMVN